MTLQILNILKRFGALVIGGGRWVSLKSSIGKRIFLSNFLVIFLTIIFFEAVFGVGVKQFYHGGALSILTDKALSNSNFYNMYLRYQSLENKADIILENYREHDEAELQVIDISGNIIASSTGFEPNEKIDVSVISNLKIGETASHQGRVNSTNEEILTVLTPIAEGDSIVGYLGFVTSMEGIKETVNNLMLKALIIGGLILVLSLILSIILSRTIVNPIKHLTEVSRKIAHGDFDVVADKKNDDEIGELSDTLNYMTEEIKKTNNLKNDFISSISHELRTPLTSIRGWAETIESGMISNQETKQGIHMILRESKRLTKLVEELLDFSRFEAGRIDMNFEKVDLNLLIKDIMKLYTIKFEEKNIKLLSRLDANITYVDGDTDRLRQVFINVIDNAYKFSHEHGTITVTTKATPQGAKICIEDNGIGIPADELPHITEKFYKGKTKHSGSGLGLSISREIIKLHRGSLSIESTEGKGTKVIIRLNM